MNQIGKWLRYFSKGEWILWMGSLVVIFLSYILGRDGEVLSLIASLIGVTALIFCAKGHPLGQVLIILFSLLYGVISYTFSYYGEMITYLGMSMPMAVAALISWVRNPYQGKHAEVAVGRLKKGEVPFLGLLIIVVTVIFFFVLHALNTANLIPSTLSVATSFCAAYLTFRRSPYYALAYGVNDLVLILLWILATFKDPGYLSVTVCFAVFFFNDLYGFINWRKMERRQTTSS